MARTTFYDSMTDTWGSEEDIKKARKNLSPAPWDIRTARMKTGFTIQEAADLVFVTKKTWICWELDPDNPRHAPMHPAYAELFALKTGLKELPTILKALKK